MAVIAIFVVPLVIFGIWSVLDHDPTVSADENRVLKARPSLDPTTLFTGKYTRDLEEYYADTFPLREAFMRVNGAMNSFYYFSGGDSALVIAHEGVNVEGGGESLDALEREFSGDNPSPSPQTASASPPSDANPSPNVPAATATPTPAPTMPPLDNPDEDDVVKAGSSIIIIGTRAMEIPYAVPSALTSYAEVMNKMAAVMPDSKVYAIAAPNGAEFYTPESMHSGARSQKDMIDKLYGQLSNVVGVDAYSKLRANVDKYIFFRTDHHWTALGAYYAYIAYCESAGLSAVPLEQFETGRYEGFVGSMFRFTSKYAQSKILKDNPDYVDYYVPIVDCSAKYYKDAKMEDGIPISVVNTKMGDKNVGNYYLCFISGDTPLCAIETGVKNGKSCIVVKESYGNAFVPFLTSHYERVFVIDPREFNKKNKPSFDLPAFVKSQSINDVIFINYPFMINNSSYIKLLSSLIK